MNTYELKRGAVLLLLLLGLSACNKLRVEVHHVPANTPENANIYITGEFNSWDPGDTRFIMEKRSDSIYFVDLPRGIGTMEYKFTRGDWTTVEKDDCGYEINNRQLTYDYEHTVKVDTIRSWSDLDPVNCTRLTVVITKLPVNTPPGSRITLVGNINDWESSDPSDRFRKDTLTGLWTIQVPRQDLQPTLEFKITRGVIDRSEGDALGNEISPRVVPFGRRDTLFIEVLSWVDLEKRAGNYITLMVDEIPSNTPSDDPIYFVGEINDWFPFQGNLMLEKNRNGQMFINLPYRALDTKYKFTRGGWGKVEVDKFGLDIDNRVLERQGSDTIIVHIQNWIDLDRSLNND